MNRVLDALAARWRYFDPKQRYQLLSGLVSYAILKLGVQLDPVLEGFIALAIGGLVGWRVPNEVSPVRQALKREKAGRGHRSAT